MTDPVEKFTTGAPCKRCGGTQRYRKGRACVPCVRAYNRSKYEANPADRRERTNRNKRARPDLYKGDHRRAKYLRWMGVDPSHSRPKPDVCEMCQGPPTAQGICFDHDHTTGRFRGWLCGRCNSGLGMLGDHIHTAMARLARYAAIASIQIPETQ